MAREHQFIAAREILSDLRKMHVRIRQSHYYTVAAIDRLLHNDMDGTLAWIPLIPSRSFHSSHILHVFFSTNPSNLDALALLGQNLYLNSNQVTHILAHLTRFSQSTYNVVRYLEEQELKSSIWHNKRDVLLNQLALTRRFDDLHSTLYRWQNTDEHGNKINESFQQYVPSAFTAKLIIQEGIKNNAKGKLLRQAQQIMSKYYPQEALKLSKSPTLGPRSSSNQVEQQLAQELSLLQPNYKTVRQLEESLFADASLPSAKAIASLVLYYQNKLHTTYIAPRLKALRERLLNRPHLKQRAKSLWTFSRMYMQLSNSSQSPDHKKDIKAKRALAIFLEVYLPIGIPKTLIPTKASLKFEDMLATYKNKSQPLLLWPDPFALGAAYASILIMNKNDMSLHNNLWSNLMSPPVSTSNRFNFIIPPSMRPDSMSCLPFLHAFSTKHSADRVREALEDMAAKGIPFAMEGVVTLLRAYASRNRILNVQMMLRWLQHQDSSFNIPHWTPPNDTQLDTIISHILPFAPERSQTRAYLDMLLQQNGEIESSKTKHATMLAN
ncbi:hypothetical protein J056_003819 [Wallemia ichthyophaga EXF-994]|uniref:Uncharacterized protein n=1 Tax=Wallemia ichthyophaga (strain EXF-994 / CBS 113033) TaxID=1299270 RepID=R9AHB2_WALI9|nr:uncharacterized protein J056_003819 [Wallemia ichthyophaga EXF-994]EOR01583.1 hypothetical protein J056_003819 [Wallemia ichthyophaga EXF-994]